MGSCVSKKAARAGAGGGGKVAAPLPVVEKEKALPPVVEEVKEVVLSETPVPRPPRPPPEPVKRRQEQPEDEEEACSTSESASVKEMAKPKLKAGGENEVEKKAVDAPEKGRTKTTAPEEGKTKGGAGNGRARSPSPSSAHRRQPGGQQQQSPAPRPRREQPAVVSGIGCRSGRFSPSAARRAAESAVRRSHSAREADMALPAKRSLAASINGNGNAAASFGRGSALGRRDPGERSGGRSDSTAKRPSACPSPVHRPASPMRKAAKEQSTPERARPRSKDGPDAGHFCDEQPGLTAGGGEHKKVSEGAGGALGQNPSVAMECFIFL
uniref:Uncharacterized protein n=1 Tax=Arundo donax TaxID=35708 RepID=A0A0A8XPC4_ARUDO